MKSSRMKFAKKLKSIRAAGEYLNQDRILQVLSAADEFIPKISNPIPQITAASSIWKAPQRPEHQTAEATELVENENKGGEAASGNEENILPPVNQIPRDTKPAVTCGSDRKSLGCGFRRPELNSITLFDPKLLEAFELAVGCFRRINDLSTDPNLHDVDDDDVIVFSSDECGVEKVSIEDTLLPIDEQDEDLIAEEEDPLLKFEERCPPGGEESVVFYTTSLRGIRKTFDDCNMIRFLLDSFKVKYYERDVSMHVRYREELRRISEETEVVLPPVLFVKGRCIGGAQRVLGLHEQGKFRELFEGVPLAGDTPCGRCDGFRFLMCDGCRGSRRIVSSDGSRVRCLLCNENGLVVCVDCSSS